MSIFASFIGIDKYRDQNVRDLAGAKRDATALWALFCDTMPELSASLLVNKDATVDAVRKSLDNVLGAAGSDDIVIVSFSGHGTHDHRLVLHDSRLDLLPNTTIPMLEIAERFKASQAKVILCILDCCFSGSAPARVLEGSPLARDYSNPLLQIEGHGRYLIAAANFNESAYENPTLGHGLLTKALIDVFQSDGDTFQLPTAVDAVIQRVRAEAGKMGITQTPVFLGYVEGGLSFPSLKPGGKFYQAFPEMRGIHVTSAIKDLENFGIPDRIVSAWIERFPTGLNTLQLAAVNEGHILNGNSLLVVAPTSTGKTFIGEMAAAKAMSEGRKSVFLLPYRALVNEKFDQFVGLYEPLDLRVIRCTGDYVDQTAQFVRGKYELALLTYEMFLNLSVSVPDTLNHLGLVVLDEAQFITDPLRGITVELLLTHLLTARERGIEPQIIALSAVIGNVNDFDAWLECNKVVSAERPVPLIEGVIDRNGVFQFVNEAGDVVTEQLIPQRQIVQRRDKQSAQDLIVPLVRHLVAQGEKIIVFRNRRGPAEGCANYLAEDLGLPAAQDVIDALPNHDLSATSARLRACLSGGTAFHNANLTREERIVVERAFRDPQGNVHVLAATTTVAAGINTPASTVILAEQQFLGEDGREFTVAEYKNMAGRAGRLGFNEKGKAIILADNSNERGILFARYVRGILGDIHSSFDPKHLDTWIVRLLALVPRVMRDEAVRLLANTYGGYLANRGNPDWHIHAQNELENLISRMISLGLVEEEGDFIQLTLLGRACGRSALSFESAMRVVELLRSIHPEELTAEHIIALIQTLKEADNGYTPVMKRGVAESVRPRQAAERFGNRVVQLLQKFVTDQFDYFGRCKRAAILWDWIHGVPIDLIEQQYSPNPYQGSIGYGDVRKFADATRFHLRSVHQIMSVLHIDRGPSAESIETMAKQLEVGLPVDALGLLAVPVSLSRGEYLALYREGIKTADEIWSHLNALERILGRKQFLLLESLGPTENST